MTLHCFSISDKGLRRSMNEDAFISDPDKGIFLVADGMGGESYGEVASRMTAEFYVKLITPFLMDEDLTVPFEHSVNEDLFCGAVAHAVVGTNSAVVEFVSENESHRGMGSTLTAVVVHDGCLYVAHIGDSRLYRIRADKIEQITEDHTKVQEMVKNHIIPPEEARSHPKRHIITRCVGRKKRLKPDIFSLDFVADDTFLISSDGLHDMVCDEDIHQIVVESESLEIAGERLVETANQSGGKDNITVVLFQNAFSDG